MFHRTTQYRLDGLGLPNSLVPDCTVSLRVPESVTGLEVKLS